MEFRFLSAFLLQGVLYCIAREGVLSGPVGFVSDPLMVGNGYLDGLSSDILYNCVYPLS